MKTRLFPLLSALFLAAAQPLHSVNDTVPPALSGEIGEVQVTASRTAKVASDRLRVITTLSRSDIRALPAQNLQELLDYLPGVDIRTRGANSVQADISMRGGTFDQTIVMLNGVNITETQTGHFNFDIPVDLSAVDRIEVLQGTSMSIFGLSAFAGAINIITGENGSNATEAAISGGDHGLLSARLGTNQNLGSWRLTASASYNGSSGYIRRWVGGYDNNITPKFTGWKEITFGGYETGIWTPVFRGTTTAGSFTYTDTNEGYYFKVGGYVYIHGKIGVSTVAASPAGAYEVTGLPYSGTPWGTNGITVGLANGGQDESMRRITSGSVQNSVIRFRALTAGNTQQWEASSTQCPLPVGGAFELYFSGWYRTEE